MIDDTNSLGSERLARARTSLEGLSVGDAFGDCYFGIHNKQSSRLQDRILLNPPWYFSDDTMMALSIVENLRLYGAIDQDRLAVSFAEHFEPPRGYGPGTRKLLSRIREGDSWRELTRKLFRGQGSYGNGGAMRVAPLGVYFADDMERVVEQARLSCEVTHSHLEGIAGAIAIAVAAAIAWQLGQSKVVPGRAAFIERILPFVPGSEVRSKIERARALITTPVAGAVAVLGNGSGISAQDTCAFTLWCAGEHLDNYEEALWLTIAGSGDCDTNCAIVGGVVAAYTGMVGIPASWRERREPLPEWPFSESPAKAD